MEKKKNKYQEALKELYKKRGERYKVFQKHKEWSKEIKEYDKVGDCLQTLQELVDKATPKKIIKINAKDNPNVRKGSLTDMVGFTYQCPTCKENMSFLSVYNYCQHCGQAFDKE